MIIVLNGASSSGKSTLAAAVQAVMPVPYLTIGVDTVVFGLPRRWLNPPLWHEVYRYRETPDGLRIGGGPLGDRLMAGLHRMVAGAAGAGWDVVVDHVLLEPRWVADLEEVLAGHPVLRVGVRCPLDELERRERARGDRTVGQARAHHDVVHAVMRYDLEVDTSVTDPAGCAALIRERATG
ncbi:MAG TPA: AAA family ATPase [Pseudonocardiaceae bacterium]